MRRLQSTAAVLFCILFQLWQKGWQAIYLIARSKKEYNLKERFSKINPSTSSG